MAARRLINLLPPSEFEGSFFGRFLKWAITAGRKVIILTELVVIMAFLSRFKLDEDIRQYNDEINGKRNLLESSMVFEDNFNAFKAKIAAAKEIERRQSDSAQTLEKVARQIPLEVRLDNLTISKTVANLAGTSINEVALKEMLMRMDKDPYWKSIGLSSIDAQEGKGVKFVLNINR